MMYVVDQIKCSQALSLIIAIHVLPHRLQDVSALPDTTPDDEHDRALRALLHEGEEDGEPPPASAAAAEVSCKLQAD